MNVQCDEPRDVNGGLMFYRRRLIHDKSEEVFADFMVFCWQMTDLGRVAAFGLTSDQVRELASELSDLMRQVDSRYGRWSAPAFWKRYISWAEYGAGFSVEECREFILRNPEYQEPSFFVFASAMGVEMKCEAIQLASCISGCGTMRVEYVCSVVDSIRVKGGM